MPNITATPDRIKPTGIYAYVDVISLWLTTPLNSRELTEVNSQCGPGGIRVRNRLARFDRDRSHQQWLQLSQPSQQVLKWLSDKPQHLNHAEVALDWVFSDEQQKDEAYAFACRYFVKRHHRQQGIRFYPAGQRTTRYTGQKWQHPNVVVIYSDKVCKVSGEADTVHVEWRAYGAKATRRMGIETTKDLIDFQYREFWKQRLLLLQVQADELGRQYQNRYRASPHRKPLIIKTGGKTQFEYHADRRTGQTLIRHYGSTQALIDAVSKEVKLDRCLVPFDVSPLLPTQEKRHKENNYVTRVVTNCSHISSPYLQQRW